jgi:hypothetical protein
MNYLFGSPSFRPHPLGSLLDKNQHWKRGSAEDYACISGANGGTGTAASRNCAVMAYQSSELRLTPVHRRDSGACQDTRRSNRPCATITSSLSVSLDSMSLPKPNPIEPQWYGPVCPVVWEGRVARRPPIPINPKVRNPRRWYKSSLSRISFWRNRCALAGSMFGLRLSA